MSTTVLLLTSVCGISAGFAALCMMQATVYTASCFCSSTTASGLHHQLIVTQESVCVLLQSPAILSVAVPPVAWRQDRLSRGG